MFAQHQVGTHSPILRSHDFVVELLQHAVLMNAGLCAKAFSPTIALLRGMAMPVICETKRWSDTHDGVDARCTLN